MLSKGRQPPLYNSSQFPTYLKLVNHQSLAFIHLSEPYES